MLEDTYFAFDYPVPYELADNNTLKIKPVMLKDSAIFLSSADIIAIDKNAIASPEIIQMSYLEFLVNIAYGNETVIQKILNIFILCLDIKRPIIKKNEIGRFYIEDEDKGTIIKAKEFEDIRRIIMYQNFPHYDDEYINPEVKEMMAEVDRLKNKGTEMPSLERKMAIISSHSGISKQEQMQMTYRAHTLLFEEVCGEVEFTTIRSVALFSGAKDLDHWIFKKKKGKFDGYFVDKNKFTKENMGGQAGIKETGDTSLGDSYTSMLNNFKK